MPGDALPPSRCRFASSGSDWAFWGQATSRRSRARLGKRPPFVYSSGRSRDGPSIVPARAMPDGKVGARGFRQRCGNCAEGGGTVRMRCHPIRWLWGLIPVAMLTWLAVHLESAPIERDLEQRSGAALSSAGHDWASVAFAGRDGLLVGHAASEDQRDEAAALVRNVWGVRVVQTRVALSPPVTAPPTRGHGPALMLRLPVASAAREVTAHAVLNDVAPTAVAAARGEIRGSDDHPPEWTVHARDEVERTVPPVGTPPVPQAAAPQSPASIAAQPAVAATPPLPEHKSTPAEPASRMIAVDVPAVPARKPVVAEAPAPPESVAAASPTPPVPEHKPEPVTAPAPPAATAAADAAQPSASAPVAPPLPQRGPRFETAALPPSNIAPERRLRRRRPFRRRTRRGALRARSRQARYPR